MPETRESHASKFISSLYTVPKFGAPKKVLTSSKMARRTPHQEHEAWAQATNAPRRSTRRNRSVGNPRLDTLREVLFTVALTRELKYKIMLILCPETQEVVTSVTSGRGKLRRNGPAGMALFLATALVFLIDAFAYVKRAELTKELDRSLYHTRLLHFCARPFWCRSQEVNTCKVFLIATVPTKAFNYAYSTVL